MPLDPRNHKDWEIAEEAESRMKTVFELAEILGLEKEELIPMGHYLGKVDFAAVLKRLKDNLKWKYSALCRLSSLLLTVKLSPMWAIMRHAQRLNI